MFDDIGGQCLGTSNQGYGAMVLTNSRDNRFHDVSGQGVKFRDPECVNRPDGEQRVHASGNT